MKVIASFTTIPSRICRIGKMVQSIARQSVAPDAIHICIPDICEKEGVGYSIPSWLEESVTITNCRVDYGPATKLLPVLDLYKDPDTIIISVDDDVVYHPHTFEWLTSCAEANTDACFGLVAAMTDGSFKHGERVSENPLLVKSGVLGGYRGIAYRRKFFSDGIFKDIEDLCSDGPFVLDDEFFAMQMISSGVQRFVAPVDGYNGGLLFRFLNLGFGIYDECEQSNRLVESSRKRLEKMARSRGIASGTGVY